MISVAPRIETQRLVLRTAERADFDAFAEMLSTERSKFMGGPFDRAGAWSLFCTGLANWPLYGFGSWIITDRDTGAFLGDVGPLQPHTFPEPELGWTLVADVEGRGLATEAAVAARDWYWANTTADTIVSYIDRNNARSIALAKRLGAVEDPDAPRAVGDTVADTAVYRHRRPV